MYISKKNEKMFGSYQKFIYLCHILITINTINKALKI